jgi:hypothetical protein
MPYVIRDEQGRLASLHRDAPAGDAEFLSDDHAEVQAFIGSDGNFQRLDADFVRVLEDVIDALIARHVINITDLPTEAQTKLFSRKSYRERRNAHALSLFGDGDFPT